MIKIDDIFNGPRWINKAMIMEIMHHTTIGNYTIILNVWDHDHGGFVHFTVNELPEGLLS